MPLNKVCIYHPKIKATRVCAQCKQPICTQCDESGGWSQKRYCKKCAEGIEQRFPVHLLTSPTLNNEIEKSHGTDFSKCELQTPKDIITNIKVGMGLWGLRDWLSPKFTKDIYIVSRLTCGRHRVPFPTEIDNLISKELIKEYWVESWSWFLWLFMPKKHEMKASKVTFGVIYQDTGHEYILGFVSVKRRPVIVVIDVDECDYDKAKEIIRRYGYRINWKAVKEYGINSNAFAGGDNKSSFFPYTIS